MKEIEKYFELFADFIETEAEAGRKIPEFKVVCGLIGAPEGELDSYLLDQVGLFGKDIIRSYNTSTPVAFL